ncbi:unnamed protein product [Caenorhabditis nigoni]
MSNNELHTVFSRGSRMYHDGGGSENVTGSRISNRHRRAPRRYSPSHTRMSDPKKMRIDVQVDSEVVVHVKGIQLNQMEAEDVAMETGDVAGGEVVNGNAGDVKVEAREAPEVNRAIKVEDVASGANGGASVADVVAPNVPKTEAEAPEAKIVVEDNSEEAAPVLSLVDVASEGQPSRIPTPDVVADAPKANDNGAAPEADVVADGPGTSNQAVVVPGADDDADEMPILDREIPAADVMALVAEAMAESPGRRGRPNKTMLAARQALTLQEVALQQAGTSRGRKRKAPRDEDLEDEVDAEDVPEDVDHELPEDVPAPVPKNEDLNRSARSTRAPVIPKETVAKAHTKYDYKDFKFEKPTPEAMKAIKIYPASGTRPEKIHKTSADCLARCSVHTIFQMQGASLTDDQKDMLLKITESVKEPHCYSVEVPLDQPFPCIDNYRNLNDQVNALLMAPPVPAPKRFVAEKYPPPVTFTGAPYLDPDTATAAEILDFANKATQIAEPLDIAERTFMFDGSKDVIDLEKEHFKKFMTEDLKENGYLPVPIFTMQTGTDEEIAQLKKQIDTTSMCIIRGLDKVIGFNNSEFTVEALSKLAPDYPLILLRNIPSQSFYNWHTLINSESDQEQPKQWRCYGYRHYVRLHEFTTHFKTMMKASEQAYKQILDTPDNSEEILKVLKEKYFKDQIPMGEDSKTHRAATIVAFGSNMDLDKEQIFPNQAKEVKKFPSFLAPAGENNLLSFSYESIGGLNKPQMYLKFPCCRTPAHFENSNLGSINHNIGPGDCLWFGIPLEFSGAFQKLLKKKLYSTAKHRAKLYEYEHWPSEADCIQYGIPVQKFIQKPGDTVYVGIGTYHWVQSLGFTTNVSWNVGHPTFNQIAQTAIINDNYIANVAIPLMGLETTMWNMIMEKSVALDEPTKAIVKRILMRSLFKAKRDYKHAKKEKLHVIYDEEKELNPVERCFNMKCKAELFNSIPLVPAKDIPEEIRRQHEDTDVASPITDTQENSYCFGCLSTIAKSFLRNLKVYQRHTFETLSTAYDEF